jgi:hypothetical protein
VCVYVCLYNIIEYIVTKLNFNVDKSERYLLRNVFSPVSTQCKPSVYSIRNMNDGRNRRYFITKSMPHGK